MTDRLSIALVTDIHAGPQKGTKRGDAAFFLLDRFADFVAAEKPDLVLDLGDRLTDIDVATDKSTLAEVAARFRKLAVPAYHIQGNHDQVHLSRADNEAILQQSLAHQVLEYAGFRLLLWQANVEISRDYGLRADAGDLDWLGAALASDPRPAIVFSHLPLDDQPMTSNYYFDANLRFSRYENAGDIQQVLLDAGNVAACFAGHVHWNALTRIAGLPFITLQSLTEGFTAGGEAAAAWGLLQITSEQISWTAAGNDPMSLTIPTGGGNRRWLAPMGRFEDRLAEAGDAAAGPVANAKGIILDLDGVIYRGDEIVPGAAEFLAAIAASGRQLVVVTNNASRTAAAYGEKLEAMGIILPAEQILTAGKATALFLLGQDASARALVVGPAALKSELAAAGITLDDKTPDFVVVAVDPDLTLGELSAVLPYLARGARLIASNPDVALPLAGGGSEAETGAVIAFLEAASGVEATVVGKPNRFIYDLALQGLGLGPADCVMIGDTLATDIAGARAAGMRAILVESGNAASDPASDPNCQDKPTLTVASVAELPALFAGSR